MKGKKLISCLLTVLLFAVAMRGLQVYLRNPVIWESPSVFRVAEEDETKPRADTSGDWKLILVNSRSYIPLNYEPELLTLSNGRKVDVRIYPPLQAMFDEARSTGLQLFVREGYRTAEEQQAILDERIREYRLEGYSEAEAMRQALYWVALPGTSEHELGIAVDINPNLDISSREEVYGWLEENAHRYGFIKRYPADKTEITGVSNEPWHFRYVGEEAAEEIYKNGWCLEEYIEELKKR